MATLAAGVGAARTRGGTVEALLNTAQEQVAIQADRPRNVITRPCPGSGRHSAGVLSGGIEDSSGRTASGGAAPASCPHWPRLVVECLNDLLDAADPADTEKGKDLLHGVVSGGGVVQVITHDSRPLPRGP